MKREILNHRNISCATGLIRICLFLIKKKTKNKNKKTNAIKGNYRPFKSTLLNDIKFQIITLSQTVSIIQKNKL